MKEPVDHILRPRLPWRTDDDTALTECGYDASKVKAITREEFTERYKEWGSQRTAMVTCMTCIRTARNWGTWEEDPRLAIGREVEWERNGLYRHSHSDRGERLKQELVAISALIEAHRDEFDAIISTNIRQKEWLEKKAALAKKPKPTTVTSL